MGTTLQLTAYNGLSREEHDLTTLDLEMDGDELRLIFPDGRSLPLADEGFASLCKLLTVPLGFAKKLRDNHRGNVLAYLQKQLGRVNLTEPASIFIKDGEGAHVLSVVEAKMHLSDRAAYQSLDKEIREKAKGELYAVYEREYTVQYFFVTKEEEVPADPEKSTWKFGHLFSYSLIGLEPFSFRQAAIRVADASLSILPFKPVTLENGRTFLGEMQSQVENFNTEGWTDLCYIVERLVNVNASLQEVKDARVKLRGLKVDADDNETLERIEKHFGWKEIVKAYEIKTLSPKPSKKWYMSAQSPYSLFYVHNKLVAEATHAVDADPKVENKIHTNASRLMKKTPDLSEKAPPKVY